MSNLLQEVELGVARALSGIPGLQVLERDTDEIKGTKIAVIKAQIDREFVPGSRIWEVSVEVALRINRTTNDAGDSAETLQSVLAALCNANRATVQGTHLELYSWFVGSTTSQWAEDCSIYLIKVRTHAVQVS
ncbi:MAG: hypothetical protein RLZZ244_1850 [Verrucomicrobiota bacterium]|jgi:hypothetical protein